MTMEQILKNIYLTSGPSILLNNQDRFIAALSSNYDSKYKTDFQILEKAIRCGAGQVVFQFVQQNEVPSYNDEIKLKNLLATKAGLNVDAARAVGLLFAMVGWNSNEHVYNNFHSNLTVTYTHKNNNASFVQAVNRSLRKYSCFSGRTGRREFIYFFLFCLLIEITLPIGLIIANGNESPFLLVPVLLAITANLLIIIPRLSCSYRRLQDVNKSGLFILLMLLPPIGTVLLLIWEFSKGTVGPNVFGVPDA